MPIYEYINMYIYMHLHIQKTYKKHQKASNKYKNNKIINEKNINIDKIYIYIYIGIHRKAY